MIFLRADNRGLTSNGKKTYLAANTSSAASSLTVISNSGFSTNDYLLIENFGSETAEIVKVSGTSGDTVINIVGTSTKFAHSDSSTIIKIPYDTVRFYHTTSTTFSAGTPLGTVDVNPQNINTVYEDSSHGSGYGWFIFINSTTPANSAPSNPIPYADFDENSAYKIINSFLMTIDNADSLKITNKQVFRWLSEGYSFAVNQLNLANQEYNVAGSYSIAVSSGTAEYALPTLFSRMTSITDSDGKPVGYADIKDVPHNNANGSADSPKYYLRGSYIGFTPTPTGSATYNLQYIKKSPYLSSYYDNVDLPNNNYFCLNDFLMYKVGPKIGMNASQSAVYYQSFLKSIETMKTDSYKQNCNVDSFSIESSANV